MASDGLVGLAMEFGRLWVGFVMRGFLWSGFVLENVLEALVINLWDLRVLVVALR